VPDVSHILDGEQIVFEAQGQLSLETEVILETKEKPLRNRILREYLVKWKFYPVEDALGSVRRNS